MSESAAYYRTHKSARDKKKKYDAALNATPKQTAKRVELNKANRKSQAAGKTTKGDNKDMAHTKRGLVSQPQSKNRGSKSAMPGDRNARGGKK